MGSTRLDTRLVEEGFVASRARARDLILRGFVTVDGRVCAKPSRSIEPASQVALLEAAPRYVSRGAEKLIAALDHFEFSVEGFSILDAGASTGGFTQVILERGAAKVFAVDVGHGQIHASLLADPRVVSIEGQDARHLSPDIVYAPVDAIVADLSFISLSKVLPSLMPLAGPGAWLAALIKPQFELGPEAVGKGGIVRDEEAKQMAIERVRAAIGGASGWRVLGVIPSPIRGGSGNEEFLIGARRDG